MSKMNDRHTEIPFLLNQSLSDIYMTLQQLEIKATPNNTKYLYGVYSEIERLVDILKSYQEVGGGNEQGE